MTSFTAAPTLAQTIAAIEAMDLSMVKFKASLREVDDGYGWSPQYADQIEVAYKRYLILHAKYPDVTLAPERDIDRFWHLHILDTRKYAADCEAAFGHFLHHFPYLGMHGPEDRQDRQDAFDEMQNLYALEFGEPMSFAPERDPGSAASASRDPQGQPAWCSFDQPAQAVQPAWCAIDSALGLAQDLEVPTVLH
jgi:hypothetical protein